MKASVLAVLALSFSATLTIPSITLTRLRGNGYLVVEDYAIFSLRQFLE